MIGYLGRSQPTYWLYMLRRSEQQCWTRLSEQSFQRTLRAHDQEQLTASTTAGTTCTSSSQIIACCFSQWMSPAEQLVRRQSIPSRYRTDQVAARYDYRAMTSLSRKTR